jgi:hypothetical protein
VIISQKAALSLLISVFLFAVFAVLAFTGLFDLIETQFYNPAIIKSLNREINQDTETIEDFLTELQNRFSLTLREDAVRRSFLPNQSAEDIFERSRLYGMLQESLRGLQSIRFIDSGGARIHYSTYSPDILRQDRLSVAYRNYNEGSGDLPYGDVNVPEGGEAKLTLDEAEERIVFSFPFYDSLEVYRGTALFSLSVRALAERLINEGRIKIGDDVSIRSVPPGVVSGTPHGERNVLLPIVSSIWNEGILSLTTLDSAASGMRLALISSKTSQGIFVGRLVDETLFSFPLVMKVILLASFFLTLYLSIFLLFNLRQDSMVIIQNRLKNLQVSLMEEFYDRKNDMDWGRWGRELEQRREDVRTELKRGIKSKSGKQENQDIDSFIDKSWDELLVVIGGQRNKMTAHIDEDKLQTILNRVLLASPPGGTMVPLSPQPAGSSPVQAPPAAAAEDLEELDSATTGGDGEELEEIEEVEALEDAEEPVELLDEAEPAEAVEELEELTELPDEAEPAEAADEPAEAVEELEELTELPDEAEPAEAVEETAEEPAEDVEELAELPDEAEPAEAVEELEELAEPEESEELAELPDEAEPAEAVEELEELAELVDEAEPAEAVEELEELTELPDEAEPAEAVEELEELAELLDEAEPADEAGLAAALEEPVIAEAQKQSNIRLVFGDDDIPYIVETSGLELVDEDIDSVLNIMRPDDEPAELEELDEETDGIISGPTGEGSEGEAPAASPQPAPGLLSEDALASLTREIEFSVSSDADADTVEEPLDNEFEIVSPFATMLSDFSLREDAGKEEPGTEEPLREEEPEILADGEPEAVLEAADTEEGQTPSGTIQLEEMDSRADSLIYKPFTVQEPARPEDLEALQDRDREEEAAELTELTDLADINGEDTQESLPKLIIEERDGISYVNKDLLSPDEETVEKLDPGFKNLINSVLKED